VSSKPTFCSIRVRAIWFKEPGASGNFDGLGQVVGSRVESGPYTSILPTGRPPG
jgi:hypothetical protein